MEHVPIWSFEKNTLLKIKEIEAILFDITEGEFKSNDLPFVLSGYTDCKISKNKEGFELSFVDGHKEYLSIDALNRKLTIKGEWWYKGIYTLLQKEDNTIVKLEVYNQAEKFRWIATLLVLPEKRKHRLKFENFIQDLENRVVKDSVYNYR